MSLVTTIAAMIDNNFCTLVDLMKRIYISNCFTLQTPATHVQEQKTLPPVHLHFINARSRCIARREISNDQRSLCYEQVEEKSNCKERSLPPCSAQSGRRAPGRCRGSRRVHR